MLFFELNLDLVITPTFGTIPFSMGGALSRLDLCAFAADADSVTDV